MRAFFVHIGPAAIKCGKYWVGYASGNHSCLKSRRTSEKALDDAKKLESKLKP